MSPGLCMAEEACGIVAAALTTMYPGMYHGITLSTQLTHIHFPVHSTFVRPVLAMLTVFSLHVPKRWHV